MDPHNKVRLKREDIHSPFDRQVWTSYQEDQYIDESGERYVPIDFFEEMNPFGTIKEGWHNVQFKWT